MIDLKNTPAHKKFKILLIGDSCEDEYFIGDCERLSPEAPVPILKIQEHFNTPGMAANVKKGFTEIGQIVDIITNDSKIKKIRYIDKRSGQHLLRVDDEPKIPVWSGKSYILNMIANYDAIVISDYNKGFLTYEHIEKLIKDNPDKPVFIDTKKTDLKRFSGAFIKINFYEYNKNISVPEGEKGLIVTNGGNGAMYNSVHYPAPKVEVADVCGAGDTFLTYLVYGYLCDKNIEHAIKLAIKAASESVKHRGNYAPTLKEIFEQ